MANYTISKKQEKVITVDIANVTKEEKELLAIYAAAGYKIVPKKADNRKEKMPSIKKSEILSYIDKTFTEEQAKTIKEKYCYITKKHTYMNVVCWFRKYCPEYPEKLDETAAEQRYTQIIKEEPPKAE